MANFGLVGVAGYIASHHLKAIKETDNNLLAALDRFDSVGIMDSYFPEAHFFTEFERYDRHLDKLRRKGNKVDYISICSPNYLHDAHIRLALRNQAHAICEKPLVLNPWDIDALAEIENETGKQIYNILQLRLHPAIVGLKKQIENELKENPDKVYDVDLTYLTSRGRWYFSSWKGEDKKSGGIATNIGVHFFDMLLWIFGEAEESVVHLNRPDAASGTFKLKHANVRWFLSVNYDYIPETFKEKGLHTFRSITVNNNEVEFSGGFTDLHTLSYQEILKGNGFGLQEAKGSIETVTKIRNADEAGLIGDYHPFCKKVQD